MILSLLSKYALFNIIAINIFIYSVLVKCANKYPGALRENFFFAYDFVAFDLSTLPNFTYYLDSENVKLLK